MTTALVSSGSKGDVEMEPAPAWAVTTGNKRVGGDLQGLAKQARGGDDKAIKQMVKMLAKLVLANSNQLREVMGTVWNTFELDVAKPVVVKIKEVNAAYFQQTKDNPKHQLGPPFLHTWTALVQTMCTDKEVPQEAKATVLDYWNKKVTKVDRLQLEQEVRYCRLRDNKGDGKSDVKKVRLQFALAHDCFHGEGNKISIHEALNKGLLAMGAIRRVGPPPRGPLEREVMKMLEQWGDD